MQRLGKNNNKQGPNIIKYGGNKMLKEFKKISLKGNMIDLANWYYYRRSIQRDCKFISK